MKDVKIDWEANMKKITLDNIVAWDKDTLLIAVARNVIFIKQFNDTHGVETYIRLTAMRITNALSTKSDATVDVLLSKLQNPIF